ncbi:MAG: toll/interleukin-1 receptor domain-containing protein [Caldisericia bacterium]|nr:toll/interleukin-1 receptor domain-containing protein [Caldisericia bacterium]
MSAYDVFIAYDTATAEDCASFLKENLEKNGIHAFEAQIDLAEIDKIGKDWRLNRDKALEEASFFVAIITSMVVFSEEFKVEFDYAIERKGQKKILLCVYKETNTEVVFRVYPQMNTLQRMKSFEDKHELWRHVSSLLGKDQSMLIKMGVSHFMNIASEKLEEVSQDSTLRPAQTESEIHDLVDVFSSYRTKDELMERFLSLFRNKNPKK